MSHIDNDPGLRLTPRGKRALLAVIVIGLLLLFAWALTDPAGAADSSGNRGGCAEVSKRFAVYRAGRRSGLGEWYVSVRGILPGADRPDVSQW
jgi:hypothetical protein